MFASVGLYLETHVLLLCLCRAFTFVVAICIPDRGHGCLNSIVKCANYVCCAFVLVQDLAKCRFGTISHHRSWEPAPLTPISAGACIDSIKDDQSRASERRPYHFGANASNFRAGIINAGPGLACGDVIRDSGSILGAFRCRNMVQES